MSVGVSARRDTCDYATQMDAANPLRHLRSEFIIPTKADLASKTLAKRDVAERLLEECVYLCGNSLGLQPKRTSQRVADHLTAWARKGVLGHFTVHEDSDMAAFLDVDDQAADMMAPLVGARAEEVAIMETLTANLHLLMASFYRPTKERNKIIIESKAFPSDHYAVESQIRHHGFSPAEALICVEPENPTIGTLSTSHVKAIIDEHAATTALILLPGVQYYTGEYFDIEQISAYAHAHGLVIGWDLAHAVGNVPLSLHDWNVDFAAWCNYKYVNAGPGSIAGLFVHSRHGHVNQKATDNWKQSYRPRLAGWWGGDKAIRFKMGKEFVPIQGARGFQVGNPSAIAIATLTASLEVFHMTTMTALRQKSVALTGYLEERLLEAPLQIGQLVRPYKIITPADPARRGAQLSILLQPGLLDAVLKALEAASVIVDERKPDVIRVGPTPLYNTYTDVWRFVQIFTQACARAQQGVNTNGTTTTTI